MNGKVEGEADKELVCSGALPDRVQVVPVAPVVQAEALNELSRRLAEQVRQRWFEGLDVVAVVYARNDQFLEPPVGAKLARSRRGTHER